MSEKSTENCNKQPMSDSMLTKLMLPSLIGIILCVIFLCGTTFAWLSDTKESGKNPITSGFFDAEIVECHSETDEETKYIPVDGDPHSVNTMFSASDPTKTALVVVKRVDGAAKGYVVAKYYDDGSVTDVPTFTQIKEIVDDSEIIFEFEIGNKTNQKIVIEPVFGMIQTP